MSSSKRPLNNSFAGTALHDTLQRRAPDRVLIAGWATNSCVEFHRPARLISRRLRRRRRERSPIRCSDRARISRATVIRHHNWVWSDLLTNRSIRLATTTS